MTWQPPGFPDRCSKNCGRESRNQKLPKVFNAISTWRPPGFPTVPARTDDPILDDHSANATDQVGWTPLQQAGVAATEAVTKIVVSLPSKGKQRPCGGFSRSFLFYATQPGWIVQHIVKKRRVYHCKTKERMPPLDSEFYEAFRLALEPGTVPQRQMPPTFLSGHSGRFYRYLRDQWSEDGKPKTFGHIEITGEVAFFRFMPPGFAPNPDLSGNSDLPTSKTQPEGWNPQHWRWMKFEWDCCDDEFNMATVAYDYEYLRPAAMRPLPFGGNGGGIPGLPVPQPRTKLRTLQEDLEKLLPPILDSGPLGPAPRK